MQRNVERNFFTYSAYRTASEGKNVPHKQAPEVKFGLLTIAGENEVCNTIIGEWNAFAVGLYVNFALIT